MEFDAYRCEELHFVKSKQGRTFTMNGRTLGSVIEQRDIGMHVHNFLNVVARIDGVKRKALSTLASISLLSIAGMFMLYDSFILRIAKQTCCVRQTI